MSPFFIALTLTDVLLLTLLVTLPLRVGWLFKVIAIVVVFSFNFLAWNSADSGRGWAVRASIPFPSQFVSCLIVEPNITTQEPGTIYVWIVPLSFKHGVLSYRPGVTEPRAYQEPYDRSLHEACLTAEKGVSQGLQVSIRRQRARRGSGGGNNLAGTYHAYVLPSPKLPRKERP